MKVLYSHSEPVAFLSYAGKPTPESGFVRLLEPGEPAEFEDFVAQDILLHMNYLGIVEVECTRSKTGVSYNLDKAQKESEEVLATSDKNRFDRWVQDMVDDKINNKRPVPMPPEPIMRIMKRRGYDPTEFGVVPLGWINPIKQLDDERAAWGKEKSTMQEQIDKLVAQVELLAKMQGGQKQAGAGK